MKITKRGTPPEDVVCLGRCRNCGTEAEAWESDPDLQRVVHGLYAAQCPVCKSNSMLFRPQPKPTRIEDEITIRSEKSSTPDNGFGDY